MGLFHLFFGNLYQSYGPLFTPKYCFHFIPWEPIGRISPNFKYAFILAISSLGSLHIIFRKFVPALWPSIYAEISLENYLTCFVQILYMHSYYHRAWDCYTFFSHICTRVMALDLRQNFVSVQYLENKLTEFHKILHMHPYWQDLRWDCYTFFFAHLNQIYGPWFTPKFRFRSISWEQIDRF